jgi:Polyketide cyclase / dehydrase and lipid transport
MANYVRVRTLRSAELPVSAQAYWDMLLDWQGIMKWMPQKDAPVPLVKVELRPGHRPDRTPCTRDCYFDTSNLPAGIPHDAVPQIVAETLLHEDAEAGFIYYNMEGIGPFGMRNYLATTEVDERGPDRVYVTCAGRFDLPEGAPVELVKGFIESVYQTGILHGISDTIQRQGKTA